MIVVRPIKILIIESNPNLVSAFTDSFASYAEKKNLSVKIETKDNAKFEEILDGFDIYSVHASLVNPLDELIRLRERNPLSYVMVRNTICRDIDFTLVKPSLNLLVVKYESEHFVDALVNQERTWEI
ncbi:MAG: hypothetical protein AABX66_03135 [Nanoarchaeota archaeon]